MCSNTKQFHPPAHNPSSLSAISIEVEVLELVTVKALVTKSAYMLPKMVIGVRHVVHVHVVGRIDHCGERPRRPLVNTFGNTLAVGWQELLLIFSVRVRSRMTTERFEQN